MLKKVVFAAALTLGFVTSFHYGRGSGVPKGVTVSTPVSASNCPCDEDPDYESCCKSHAFQCPYGCS